MQREDVWCKSSRGAGKGPLELRAGNGPPAPAVTGNEVRASQARIQVEPRTKKRGAVPDSRRSVTIVRPEPKTAAWGVFYFRV